ncbi:MAG: baseplate J/gp47 family protein [Chloroflexi bacterium]|nr:baseplate J/gp47 family protein [Chloroflexota bacterium]
MTALIYLDTDDEITSAAARLRLLKEGRIALVLPPGSRLATSRINFRLLAREAATHHKTVEIVTGDASARALAASAGLPTHVSVAAFEAGSAVVPTPRGGTAPRAVPLDDSPTLRVPTGEAIPRPRTSTPVPQVGRRSSSSRRGRALALVLVLVAILAAGGVTAFQLLPSATIVLVPSVATIGPISLSVTAQPGITQPDPVGLLVPATKFSFEVSASDMFPSTGLSITEAAATGEVTFSSLNTGASNSIAGGSVVKTQSGVEFRTTGPVTLPAAQIGIIDGKFVVIPSTRKIAIEAVVPGLAGNVDAGAIVIVPERENPQRTLVKNDAPTAGGTREELPVVQQADIDAALKALDAALAQQFEDQLTGVIDVPPGTTLFPQTRALGPSTPTVIPTTLIGLEQASFELGATARGTVLGVDPGPVSTLADARLRSSVDDGFELDEASISSVPGTPIVAGTTITFPIVVRATETRQVDGPALLARIRGLGLPQARTILESYGEVTITVWPEWVTTIPQSDSRVTLTIETPAATGSSPAGSPGSFTATGAAP